MNEIIPYSDTLRINVSASFFPLLYVLLSSSTRAMSLKYVFTFQRYFMPNNSKPTLCSVQQKLHYQQSPQWCRGFPRCHCFQFILLLVSLTTLNKPAVYSSLFNCKTCCSTRTYPTTYTHTYSISMLNHIQRRGGQDCTGQIIEIIEIKL